MSVTVRGGFGFRQRTDPSEALWRIRVSGKFLMLFAALAAAGCMTEGQFLASRQPTAMQVAVSRGQFEMNCPSATGEVLSQEFTQAIQAPIVQAGYSGLFTIGVTGCGQRRVYQVFCAMEGDGCTPLEGRTS